jgi:copper homeostasis protein
LDLIAACKQIKESNIGITHILSSGGKETAMLGSDILLKMKTILGSKIGLIAAGKITFENLDELHQILQLRHYHGRRLLSF